jgi:cytochrome c oxidase subunit 3
MPSIFTPTPTEIERKKPGTGGKPPVTRRPTGGGGGGGDDDRRDESRGPGELLRRVRFFVFFALAGDVLFFAIVIGAFFVSHAGIVMDPRSHTFSPNWHPVILPRILYVNTALLVLSSLTIEFARRHIFREIDVLEEWLGLGRPALRNTLPWIAATLALGILFLIGQGLAWRQLSQSGFSFDRYHVTPASYFFYLMTGMHAAHLMLGVLALVGCLCALGLLKRVEYRQVAVDSTAWFWHFMGATWLVLFAILALGQ